MAAIWQMLSMLQTCVCARRAFFLLVFNVLAPPRTLSSPPPALRWMRVGAAIGQTHPSHRLDFWGETSLWSCVCVCCNHTHSQLGLWTRMILSFWQPAYTLNGEPCFPFRICLTLVSFHLFSDSVYCFLMQ